LRQKTGESLPRFFLRGRVGGFRAQVRRFVVSRQLERPGKALPVGDGRRGKGAENQDWLEQGGTTHGNYPQVF
jgi:hypothetical protein